MLSFLILLQSLKPVAPETIWPTSVFGWVSGLFMVVSFTILLRKSNNDPILKEMVRIENDFKLALTNLKSEVEKDFQGHDKRVEDKINGWSARIADNRVDIDRVDTAVAAQALELIRSQEDRRQLNVRQAEVGAKLDTLAGQFSGLEGRMRDRLDAQTREIMTAIHKRIDTR